MGINEYLVGCKLDLKEANFKVVNDLRGGGRGFRQRCTLQTCHSDDDGIGVRLEAGESRDRKTEWLLVRPHGAE